MRHVRHDRAMPHMNAQAHAKRHISQRPHQYFLSKPMSLSFSEVEKSNPFEPVYLTGPLGDRLEAVAFHYMFMRITNLYALCAKRKLALRPFHLHHPVLTD